MFFDNPGRLASMVGLAAIGGRRRRYCALIVAAMATMATGCGGDDGGGGDASERGLSAEAARGRQLAEDNGCQSCHQPDGDGIGPGWRGLSGSTVELADGSTVVADDAYLVRAITDPAVEKVDGYSVAMPSNGLDDDEVAAIVTYIRSLGEPVPVATEP